MRTNKFGLPFRLVFVTPEVDGGGGGDDPADGDLGFPANTPVKEMTAEQQAAYYKHASKKWEKKAKTSEKNVKPADFDQLLADAEAFRKQQEDGKSPDEKALDAARQKAIVEAKAEAEREFLPVLVRAEFARRLPDLSDEQLDELLEDVAPATYYKDGAVDKERVERMAARLAPAKEDNPPLNLGHFLGGSNQQGKGMGSSIAEAEARTLAKYQKTDTK